MCLPCWESIFLCKRRSRAERRACARAKSHAAIHSLHAAAQRVMPNPSLEPGTSTGKPLGPRTGQCHHPLHGPSAFPAPAPQLKR